MRYRKVGPCTATGGCKPRFDWEVLRFLHNGVALLALSLLVFCLVVGDGLQRLKKRDWSDSQSRALAATGLIIAAVIVNAAVCGILSGVFARYQTRVIWLLPMVAGMMVLVLAREGVWRRLGAARVARAPAVGLPDWVEPAFLRFGVVGACGFTVDAVVLYVLVHGFGVNAYSGRFVSFAVAVMVTWLLNRTFTFRTSGNGGRTREALVYFGVQASGGAANIAVYSLALLTVPFLKNALIIPLVMGSAAGLCLTYAGSKHLAFRPTPSRGPESMAAE